jgi:hypothetical protein
MSFKGKIIVKPKKTPGSNTIRNKDKIHLNIPHILSGPRDSWPIPHPE